MAASPSRLAFGSCNSQDLQNNFWPIIERRVPAGFIWGGDSIYADKVRPTDWSEFPPKLGGVECADGDRLRRLYSLQRSAPGYNRLVHSNITIFGTFDDHDFGCDNSDQSNPFRVESAEAFVDFIDQPRASAMATRASAGLGVYGVKVFDFDRPIGRQVLSDLEAGIDPDVVSKPQGTTLYSNKTVAVFVLDVRSNKTPWKTGLQAFKPDLDGDFLGERQWEWFEEAISRSRAAVNVVVNGLQVHSDIFPNGNMAESWSKYPKSQQRLFDALLKDSVSAPILISGDVHMTQLMRKDCKREVENPHFRPLVEFTTSGMTHSWGSLRNAPLDNPSWKPTTLDRYGAFVSSSLMGLLNQICPWTNVMRSENIKPPPMQHGKGDHATSGGAEGAKTGLQYSLQKNFGELDFNWESRTVMMRAIGEDETPLLSAKWTLDQLSGKASAPGSLVSHQDFITLRREAPTNGVWTCINHRGPVNEIHHLFGHVVSGACFFVLIPLPYLIVVYLLLGVIRRYRTNMCGKVRASISHNCR